MQQKLWQRYLFKEVTKLFCLILFSVYFLYVLIDYSTHFQAFAKDICSLRDIFMYYAILFSKRLGLLLPLALIIATVKVLCTLNRHNELLAFQTAGLSLFSLSRPFFFFSLCCTCANVYNFEYFLPTFLVRMHQFKYKHVKIDRSPLSSSVHSLVLANGTHLIYQCYDKERDALLDVFLIDSIDKVWHAKELLFSSPVPIASFADMITRNDEGLLEKKASFKSYPFYGLTIDLDAKQTFKDLVKSQSLSQLFKRAFYLPKLSPKERATAQTHLYHKCLIAFLPFLVLIGVIPFCTPSKRHLPVFFIFSISIFSYIALFTFLDACVILGENKVIPPHWALLGVPSLLFTLFGLKFVKTCIGLRYT